MKMSTNMQCFIHKNLVFVAGLILCVYFSFHIAYGQRSYSQLNSLTQISSSQKIEISTLKSEKKSLEKKVSMMRSETLSVDLAEEQIRKYLGYHHKDELIVLSQEMR